MTQVETLPASQRTSRTERIPVAVLGATGSVGQRFVQLLENHPWFRLHEVVASERSAGRPYGEAADWRLDTLLPDEAAALTVKELGADLESRLLFSGLDSLVAGEAEDRYANHGCVVVSNSRNHRMDDDVPLLIPEINADHIGAIERQQKRRSSRGYIVTNPNCSTIGLAMAIAPIERLYGIDQIHVTTMQAISGAGYAGVPSYAILDNVIPFIGGGEEEKIESEPRKILGLWHNGKFENATFRISAQVNRVPTIDGHLMTISLSLCDRDELRKISPIETLIDGARMAIEGFGGEPQRLQLPSAPKKPLHYIEEKDRPQPRLDRDREHGMSVSVGRLRPCPLLDMRMVALVHNTIRGAAGAALLNAELLEAEGLL
ncbi:MAG TPA: aspartate-semialdehyde dehydrogenase [Thermoanaerobaculia bacterium]|jgi:aspartate-semialdehyde dehydrogenase|nr:aspartate-semialdehyde dehydrogenase [Thermoanaerobaculia bacterium]